VVAKNGMYSFSKIKLIANPNSYSYLRYVSNAIDYDKVRLVSNKSIIDEFMTEKIYFRQCILGESNVNNMCVNCSKGFYSYNSTQIGSCNKCFDNGICNGGDDIGLLQGYWRIHNLTTKTYECPDKNSCLGSEKGEPVKCATGYSGRLCNICSKEAINGSYYARSGQSGCSKCSPIGVQIVVLIVFFAGLGVYLIYLLTSLLNNPLRNKPQTVLIRIITNYSQAIMIVYEFDLNWPQ
jgi:hypothetical protein